MLETPQFIANNDKSNLFNSLCSFENSPWQDISLLIQITYDRPANLAYH